MWWRGDKGRENWRNPIKSENGGWLWKLSSPTNGPDPIFLPPNLPLTFWTSPISLSLYVHKYPVFLPQLPYFLSISLCCSLRLSKKSLWCCWFVSLSCKLQQCRPRRKERLRFTWPSSPNKPSAMKVFFFFFGGLFFLSFFIASDLGFMKFCVGFCGWLNETVWFYIYIFQPKMGLLGSDLQSAFFFQREGNGLVGDGDGLKC